MAHYINKDTLVAEIKSRISDIEVSQKAGLIKKRDADKKILLFKNVLSLIDTIEVKEVQEESVSEELEEASRNYADNEEYGDDVYFAIKAAFKEGAKWQKEQMMSKAIDGEVGYWNLHGLSVNVDLPLSADEGDKVKVLVVKEE